MERLKLYRSGQVVGELTAEPEGLYLRFRVRCDPCGEGVFRAFAVGERGEVLLGVLEPVSGILQLSRCLSRSQLAPAGQLLRGEVRRLGGEEESAWQSPPGEVWEQMPLCRRLDQRQGALWREEAQRRCLALPYDSRQAFPLPELFCLARVEKIGDGWYVVYTFDRQGRPVIS